MLPTIKNYLASLPPAKSEEMTFLHELIVKHFPSEKLWFEDGKNEEGKVVSNPNIGYGQYTIHYANGTSREFFRVGISANTTGISVYIMGLSDKSILQEKFGDKIGNAKVTGYCIKFKKMKDIHLETLLEAIDYSFSQKAN